MSWRSPRGNWKRRRTDPKGDRSGGGAEKRKKDREVTGAWDARWKESSGIHEIAMNQVCKQFVYLHAVRG